jgi:hypothetical protein
MCLFMLWGKHLSRHLLFPVTLSGFFTAAHLLTARLRQRVVAQLTNHPEGTPVGISHQSEVVL